MKDAAGLTIALAQFNTRTHGRSYLPYSVALLQAYAMAHSQYASQLDFLLPLYRRMPVEAAAAYLGQAQVIGLSTYVWSMELSLAVARAVKALNPQAIIVFGGPHTPDRAEAFLRENPQVDIAIHGEGELAFTRLLDALYAHFHSQGDIPRSHRASGVGASGAGAKGPDAPLQRSWQSTLKARLQVLGNLSFLDEGGRLIVGDALPRLKALGQIPSPFLNGQFDALIAANPEEHWLGTWETNRGCPFFCTFCDWGSATGSKIHRFPLERLEAEIHWMAKARLDFVFCADANFGILPRDVTLAEMLARVRQETGYPQEMCIQNTKNAVGRAKAIQAKLFQAGLIKEVVLSLQSLDDATLTAIKRQNISLDAFAQLQRYFTAQGIPTYTDIVLGLPGETLESFKAGIVQIIEGGQYHRVKFYNLGRLPNAPMASPAYQARHGLITRRSRLINIQDGGESEAEPVAEYQEIVVGTKDMPPEDWRVARVYAYFIEMLYFDKWMQMPINLAKTLLGLPLAESFNTLIAPGDDLVGRIYQFFLDKAASIAQGEPEQCAPTPWLGTYSTPTQYAQASLLASNQAGAFYRACGRRLRRALRLRGASDQDLAIFDAALALNQGLLPLLSSAKGSETAAG